MARRPESQGRSGDLSGWLRMTWQTDKPIIGVVGFNLFTLLVFVTAPVRWYTDNLLDLCLFVLLCQLLVLLGFRLGRQTGPAAIRANELPFFRGGTLVNCLFAVYVLTVPISYAYKMGFGPSDIVGMVNRILLGLQDPHFSYAAAQDKPGGPIPWTVYFVISIFNQAFFASGFLYWRHLRPVKKVVFVIFLGIEILYWVGIATSFGVVSLATTFGLSTMFWPARVGRWRTRKAIGGILLASLLLGVSVGFFSYNLYRRSNFAQIDVERYEIARSPVLPTHPVLALVPEALRPTYVMVASYMGQGYYHTCFAFDLEFRSTAFLGNNPALIGLAAAFGLDVWEDTYMHRLHGKGIDEFGDWHSAYTWFACDVTFYGVPVLLFFFGYLFGFSWAVGVQGDFLSRVVFIMFGNILLFLFANNTYLSSVFCSFAVVVPMWMLTRFVNVARIAAVNRQPTLAGAEVPAAQPDKPVREHVDGRRSS